MIRDSLSALRPALILFALLSCMTGIVYPLAILGIARTAFPGNSGGSPVARAGGNGEIVGSALIGQAFESPRYFHPRPSAVNYNAATSGGSNLGPTNPKLLDAVKERVAALREANASIPSNVADAATTGSSTTLPPIPVDLVTASASGLDPDITPAGARFQAPRIARARGLPLAAVQALVESNTEGRTLGILGEPRVNVLRLNLALDARGKQE